MQGTLGYLNVSAILESLRFLLPNQEIELVSTAIKDVDVADVSSSVVDESISVVSPNDDQKNCNLPDSSSDQSLKKDYGTVFLIT